MDLAKAFDTVDHNVLLFKLDQYGIRAVAYDLISSYLNNRRQLVAVNNYESDEKIIETGVPQGSVLGPLFFLIYINDLTRCSNFDVTLYADDSVLTLAHKDVLSLQNNVNHELLKIDEWLRINKLTVNLDKTNFLLFSNCSRTPKFNISFAGSSIKQCDSVKYLGVYLDDKLNWNRHVGYVITKLSSASAIFYKLRNLLPINILISVYYRPCCTVLYLVVS